MLTTATDPDCTSSSPWGVNLCSDHDLQAMAVSVESFRGTIQWVQDSRGFFNFTKPKNKFDVKYTPSMDELVPDCIKNKWSDVIGINFVQSVLDKLRDFVLDQVRTQGATG